MDAAMPNDMTPIDVLDQARAIFEERGREYGGVQDLHERIARIGSELTGHNLTARDVALVMMAVKLARLSVEPKHIDSYVDLVNYAAFACTFSATGRGKIE